MDEKELQERVERFEERMKERSTQGKDEPPATKEPQIVGRKQRIGF